MSVLLSQTDLQYADLSFEPPIVKMAANRKVLLISSRGLILEGITYSKKKGLKIPDVLEARNKPELNGDSPAVEQLVSAMTREILTIRINEQLSGGTPLWPEHRGRR